MKKIILSISLLFGLTLLAQKSTKQPESTPVSFQKGVFKQALTYSDASTAINSLHNIIALEGSTSTYKDSLAILYYKIGNYASSYLISKELLQTKPEDLQLLEIEANSLQNLGSGKEATEVFENLFAKTKNMYHGYQLANLQYSIKRLAEAKVTVEKALACEPIEKATLRTPIDKTNTQDVPLKAVVYNLKGMINFDLKDNESAKKAFEESLKIMPEYVVAKENLSYLEKETSTPDATTKTTATKTPTTAKDKK